MDLSIIIVNWNSAAHVKRCLQSVYKFTQKTEFEVIVVDGGSFDSCGEMLAREFPDVHFIQSPDNCGFGQANNLGARNARGRVLLLLNPDTELLEDSISILMDRLNSLPQAGAVGCRLLNGDRTLQTACVQSFPTILNQALDAEFIRNRFPNSSLWGISALYATDGQPAVVEAISGACVLVKKDVFDKVGGFSPCYFMYGEDLDLCFKIRQAGCLVYHVPQTSILHFGGGSTSQGPGGFSTVMMRESVCRFLHINRGLGSALAYRAVMALTALVRMAVIAPLLLVRSNGVVQHGSGSLRKWVSILRWSVGLKRGTISLAGKPVVKPTTLAMASNAKS